MDPGAKKQTKRRRGLFVHSPPAAPPNTSAGATASVPPGTPTWITPELIAATLRVWQPYYAKPLSIVDALEILQNTARLLESLK